MFEFARITYAMQRRRSLCGDCLLENVCAKAEATVPSLATIRMPKTRLAYQNHLVGLQMPSDRIIDHLINTLRDFPGRFVDETGATVDAPGIASLLRLGSAYWLRDQLGEGAWGKIADVPRFRSEATGRWVIIGSVMNITETIQPICPRL